MTTITGNMPVENRPQIPRIKGILFDLDGVLIDSEPLHEFTLLELSDRFGRRFGQDEILQFKGLPELSVAHAILKSFPDLALTIDQVIRFRLELLKSNFHRVEMIEGALAFVQRVKAAGFRLGLTTSAARSMQQLACETFALSPYFDTIITGEDIERGKPDPQPYERTAANLALRPDECMVVEDAVNGVKSGKAAGCFVVGITTSFTAQALRLVGSDLVVPSFAALEVYFFEGGARLRAG
jgi:HAD superfamily hydrolase (TIGR01509 family)